MSDSGAVLDALRARVPALTAELPRVLAASRFVREALPALIASGADFSDFSRPLRAGEIAASVDAALAGLDDAAVVMRELRRARQRHMVRIAVRDLAGAAALDETLHELSDLADACLGAALRHVEQRLQARHGVPRNAAGEPIRPVVLGMGKLGGRELNFSSDIDLIFCHTDSGETDGARALSSDEYFARLAQETTKLLIAQTADGFVFRVDTMLRPFGSAGALSASFPALEDYYQVHGREWERYALIKARPVAGDLDAGQALLARLRPFVYRRYLDFNAIGALRELKRMIAAEVSRKGLEDNVKLGAGGIREIEFIAQAFQLVRGGQDARLRDARLRPTLRHLGEAGLLPDDTAPRLDAAYVFLRRLENAIQMYADEQTHALPRSEEARAALCLALGFPGWPALLQRVDEVRSYVQTQFERVFSEPPRREDDALDRALRSFWQASLNAQGLAEALRAQGYGDSVEGIVAQLQDLRDSRLVRGLSEPALLKLTGLLPLLLAECVQQPPAERSATRVLQVVQAIAGRSTYVTLLRENPGARQQLLRLCAASPWATQMLARSPMLLDQLLDARTLYAPPQHAEMREDLAELISHLAPGDTEAGMDLLRRYRQETMLRIVACDLAGQLPLRKVCDHLTWLAESIVERALDFAWNELKARYGEPPEPAFAVIAYGKLGGIELGYGSDLDLVFLHDGPADAETQGAERSLSAGEFYVRLAQRLIHWLQTQTPAGRAYEVDMQLRPSGNSGLLVTSLDGFRSYQLNDAWTWEHQALCRARPVAGHAAPRARFEQIRREVLTRPRDAQKLRQEVIDMRARMHQHLEQRAAGRADLKQGEGGMTDLEFITQYLVLREAARVPALIEWSDNRRHLEALARAGVIAPEEEARLVEIYDAYRIWFHARSLQNDSALIGEGDFRAERDYVRGCWKRYLG